MRSFRNLNVGIMGLVGLMAILVSGQAFGASQIAYELELGGNNNGGASLFTMGNTADGQSFQQGTALTWAVRVAANGIHSQPGHPSDNKEIYGAANLVFDIEIYEADGVTLASYFDFSSSVNPGKSAEFALSYNLSGLGPGAIIDPLAGGGPRMEPIYTYPTAEPGKLIGMGAGYKEWNRSGGNSTKCTPGIGMTLLPGGTIQGLGVKPVAEGQVFLDPNTIPLGTYVLKVKPGNGNNVLRGDFNMVTGGDQPAFAVAVNGTAEDTITFNVIEPGGCVSPEVRGRYVFYNNSRWDGNNVAANASDDNAIAPDKTALLPGQTATFANYISYSKGINGIMVDICNVPDGFTPVVGQDVLFLMGNNNDPLNWVETPPDPVSMTVRYGDGVDDSDRLTFIWADNAIPNSRWLLVYLVGPGGQLNLPADDIFFFGVAAGESGNNATNALVDGADIVGARDNPHTILNLAPLDDLYDYNRDRLVDGADIVVARDKVTTILTALKLISVP